MAFGRIDLPCPTLATASDQMLFGGQDSDGPRDHAERRGVRFE